VTYLEPLVGLFKKTEFAMERQENMALALVASSSTRFIVDEDGEHGGGQETFCSCIFGGRKTLWVLREFLANERGVLGF
jgi:hypothetical protein